MASNILALGVNVQNSSSSIHVRFYDATEAHSEAFRLLFATTD